MSLLERVRDLSDRRSWGEFYAIYGPLIFRYLRALGLGEDDAEDLRAEVFARLLATLPTFELDRWRARFRTYLWKLTHNAMVDRARRRKVRDRAEEEWVRRFREADESASRELERTWIRQHRRRILEVVLPRARASASATAWACFEGRLVHRRSAAEIAGPLGIPANAVYVYASRVLKDVRRRCAEIEGEGCDVVGFDLP
jgi:RNA polymerase sigma-70 factor (ECF subfamily)